MGTHVFSKLRALAELSLSHALHVASALSKSNAARIHSCFLFFLHSQVTELNEQLMRAHFEKREGESDKTRAAEEVYRLSQELANSRKALEMKNKELSTALASFADHQKKAEDR